MKHGVRASVGGQRTGGGTGGRTEGGSADVLGNKEIAVLNRQRRFRIRRGTVEEFAAEVLGGLRYQGWEVGIHLVGPGEMAEANWAYLKHEGSTDILTFDHGSVEERAFGEMYICTADAERQGAEFGTDWAEELVRYVVHGCLHLKGYDDTTAAARRVMKRVENRWVRRSGAWAARLRREHEKAAGNRRKREG